MATTKITDLTAYTDPVNTDVLPIVDVTSDVTKKVSIANVMKNASLGTAALPGVAFDGDPNTGLFSAGGDQIAIVTGGTARLTSTTTALTSTLPIDVPLGAQGTPSLTFTGDLNTGIFSPGADQVAISTGGSGRLFVDASGNVSVGASPSGGFKFEVKAGAIDTVALFDSTHADGPHVRFSTSGTDRHYLGSAPGFTAGGTSSDFAIRTAGYLALATGGNNERLRITSAGLVGIGTSSPVDKLHVDGRIAVTTDSSTPTTGEAFFYKSSTGAVMSGFGATIETGSAGSRQARISVNSSGNVGIGTASPNNKLDIAAATANIGIDGTSNTYINFLKSAANIGYVGDANWMFGNSSSDFGLRATSNLVFGIGANEKARLDSSGRLLVGTSSARSAFGVTSNLQAEGTDYDGGSINLIVNNNSGAGNSSFINLCRSRGITKGSNTVVQADDSLGAIAWCGADGSDLTSCAASIRAFVDGTPGADDMPGRLVFSTTADGAASPTERMRIKANGDVYIGKDNDTRSNLGFTFISSVGVAQVTSGAQRCLDLNRQTDDGTLIEFFQANTFEGSISVSGTTVSYNGAHLSRWSQLPSGAEREEILRGSVLSNIDEMCEWGDEENEQLNRMKVSDVEGDKNVSGVFQCWDDDDDTYTNDFYCAMTGDFIIRIAEGVTVERGDLLMSAGDGTAKPQDDDIIRSKTIAKVTSTNVSCTYEDGSYCVPCVLMAC